MADVTSDVAATESEFRAKTPANLLVTQKRAVGGILKQFAQIAQRALEYSRRRKADLEPGRDVVRPHHVFTIDGARGSGKTYTLLSLENAIQQLSDSWHDGAQAVSEDARHWYGFLDTSIGEPTSGQLKALRRLSPDTAGLAQVLSIIFPGDMEGHESLMEAIFAAMMKQLQSTADRGQDKSQDAKAFREKLRTQVAQGWYFARNFGHDAIVRDSIDYTETVAELPGLPSPCTMK